MLRVKKEYRWLALGLVLALLVLLAGGIDITYAKLVKGVLAKTLGDQAIELKMTADRDGKVEITIGSNQITFRLQADEELDTGLLRISGDELLIKVFADSTLTDECTIAVGDIPTEYKRFCYDETPPVVRVSRSPSPNANGWNKGTVTTTITAEDEEDGSGIKSVFYKIGTRSPVEVGTAQLSISKGGRVATYSLRISDEGTHQLGFWAVDQADNESEHQALTVRIDTTKPSISVSLSRTSIYQGDSIQVTVRASDSLSGIDSVTASDSNLGGISLSRSGDQWRGSISPTRSGRVTATAKDKADNSNSDSASYSVEARPGYFDVTGLSVSPSSPQVNQSVTIKATIKNSGEESATKTVTLYIEGSRKDSKSLTLSAGRSDTVSFSYTFSYSGTYTVKVSTPDDSKSTTVRVVEKPKRPAYFDVTSLSVPSSVDVGESVSIKATVKNTGEQRGTQDVDLYVGGDWEDSERITLNPGESKTVRFYYTFYYGGSYTVKVKSDDDSASRTVKVREAEYPPAIVYVDAQKITSSWSHGYIEAVYVIYIVFEDDGDVTAAYVAGSRFDVRDQAYGYSFGEIEIEFTVSCSEPTTYAVPVQLKDEAGNYSNEVVVYLDCD